MQAALHDPESGYYRSGVRIGTSGDFVTSPEVSQVFGELLGLSLAQSWVMHGRPHPIGLVELGPGTGTLLADMLRAAGLVDGFHDAFRGNLFLVESNADFRRRQSQALSAYEPKWIDEIDSLPRIPMYLVANEFFDCLPVRVFRRSAGGWRETKVMERLGRLVFTDTPLASDATVPDCIDDSEDHLGGEIFEVSRQARELAARIGRHIGSHGGCAIVIDYGDWGSDGFTVQAVRRHQKCHVLAHPGDADLTAHVDFRAIARASGAHAQVSKMIEQGELLKRLGIVERMEVLAKRLSGERLQSHLAAGRRLTCPSEMGELYKAICIVPNGAAFAPGFD